MKSDWEFKTEFAMGGTTDVGFSPDSKNLLIITHSGRGLYDVNNLELITRNEDVSFSWHRDFKADGIGPCAEITIPINGIYSEIPKEVKDEISDFDTDSFITELKAAAISPDGEFLVLGYSSDFQIYKRNRI